MPVGTRVRLLCGLATPSVIDLLSAGASNPYFPPEATGRGPRETPMRPRLAHWITETRALVSMAITSGGRATVKLSHPPGAA